MTNPLLSLGCTCASRDVDRYTACAVCRTWSRLHASLERIRSVLPRERRPTRTEIRLRAIENILRAHGLVE